MSILLRSLTFSDGTTVALNEGITVIVGPNNCGKSRALLDIERHLTVNGPDTLVVKDVDVEYPRTFDELLADTGIELLKFGLNDGIQTLNASLTGGHGNQWPPQPGIRSSISQGLALGPKDQRNAAVLPHFGHSFVARLGTEQRLTVAKQGGSANPDAPPQTLLQYLYRQPKAAQQSLDKLFFRLFKTHIRLDFSGLIEMLLRVGDDIWDIEDDLQAARPRFKTFESLDLQGDGMRGFVSVCLALDVLRRPITLLDEPEAFLHPPQALALGRVIAENPHRRQIVIATHSTDLLRGLLAARDIKVIRLTRAGTENRPHVLEPSDLRAVLDDPLLSSSRVLDGLFYNGVVVTEADADRTFYEAVAAQLDEANNVHFTHAHNKQTIPKVVTIYKSLNVPCASVVDFDVLREKADLISLLRAHGAEARIEQVIAERELIVKNINADPEQRLTESIKAVEETLSAVKASSNDPEERMAELSRIAERVKNAKDPWRDAKESGKAALSGDAAAAFDRISSLYAAEGAFIVPVGELESWLRDQTSLPREKPRWIIAALQLMPILKANRELQPWKFVSEILSYLSAEEATVGQDKV